MKDGIAIKPEKSKAAIVAKFSLNIRIGELISQIYINSYQTAKVRKVNTLADQESHFLKLKWMVVGYDI